MKIVRHKLSAEDIREAIAILKKNERKPVWRFTKEFPFLKKFYIIYPNDLKSGKTIDYHVKKTLGKG